jgi:hypothetical protein
MSRPRALVACALLLACALILAGCGPSRTLWHDERLPSGRTIRVTSFMLVWGAEHDDRDANHDCFALEYVMADPQADVKTREAEAAEAFELVRPASERWGFGTATLAAFRTLERKGRYDQYVFRRAADGRWSSTRTEQKVYATD